MSVTIAVEDKTLARIRLTITSTAGETVRSITRTDSNGTRTVRVEAGFFPKVAPSFLVSDYEYPLLWHEQITYTVRGNASTILATLVIDAASPHFNNDRGLLSLVVPLRPASGIIINNRDRGGVYPLNEGEGADASVVVRWDDTRAGLSTLHTVVGRSTPIPVLRAAAARTGTIEVACPDLAHAQELQTVLGQPFVFLLRQSDQHTLDVYFVVTGMALTHWENTWKTDPQPERRWTLSVQFAEVAYPSGPVTPITVWTYAQVQAAYTDYTALGADFSTYANLLERIPTS